ncbi:hypothetical protein CFK37_13950 [Virgibacillus phasianinus]|uniref:DUF2624 domain-containing protein n=1 Tax=Virgibacillus phasianinus TaxID=2017483 RepID=A0A220U4G8_9BACI|nr:DUF2624 domain-containing protein [Virgibacillus phasianinus]ASK63174.1 hypothetical protein CFK37_13950 [Virgibacillus phasianinus]
MSNVMKDLITKKIKQISPEELLHYSKQYGFSLTRSEAKQITNYVKNHPFDPFSESDRVAFFKELARMTDMQTTKKAQKLFGEMVRSYGIQSLF